MVQTRRVFETTNTLVNYAFLILVLLFAVFVCTSYFSVMQDFIQDLSLIVNIFAWTMLLLGVVFAIWSAILAGIEKVFPWKVFIWNIFRILISLAIAFGVNALNYLFSGIFEVTL